MQQLSAKDQAVFRSIVRFYETKQAKKGIKAADSILKKHPEHGETLCMKGLTLSYLGKKEEAYELVRKGLRHDVKSHVCWHVYGLLYRQDRDYVEAVKCYRCALRIDPENVQILRDLSLLQINRRDFPSYAETRRKLLQAKPSNRLNWIGYAVSEHLCQSYEFAWTCIDNYEQMFKDETVPPYEVSELFLYKATIMEEAGKFEESLACLNQHEKEIVDKLSLLEMKGRLLMFLRRYDEASEVFKTLIGKNQEHHTYILAYMANQLQFQRFWPALPAPVVVKVVGEEGEDKVGEEPLPTNIASFPQSMHPSGMPIWGWLQPQHSLKPQPRTPIGARLRKHRYETYEPVAELTEDEEVAVCDFFENMQREYPRSDALQRLVMHFVSGERFKQKLDSFLRKRIRKGIPSLFRMVRPLYFQKGKAALAEELLLQYVKFLQEDISWFGPPAGEKDAKPPTMENEEAPSTLLFSLMAAADHFDFMGDPKRALALVEQAIAHTPTFVEIYACKARIYKHHGNLVDSAKMFDEVRSMDLADRFLNTMCVRSYLRVDDVKQGRERALLFSHTKEPDSPEGTNLYDMQCMWYECAVGRSYYRQKMYGKALKEFSETFRHFNDISEDQFDFHNYCLRKTTLKAYVAMLRMQDNLYSHKFYRRAAKETIRIYLDVYDKKLRGEAIGNENGNADEDADASAADKKKQKHKQKREKKKVDDEKEAKAAAVGGKAKKIDDDPDGEKLLEKDPLEECAKLAKNLVVHSALDPATHVLTYDIYSRQGKLLHCLQALLKLFELGGRNVLHYKFLPFFSHFCLVAKLDAPHLNAAVRDVILSEVAAIVGAPAPFADVETLRSAASTVIDKAEARLKLSGDQLPVIEVLYGLRCLRNAGRDCTEFLDKFTPSGPVNLKDSKKMLSYLVGEFGKDAAVSQKYLQHCKDAFYCWSVA